MMIWDLQCHLTGVSGRTPDERMAQLIEFADRMGIDRMRNCRPSVKRTRDSYW